MSDSDEDDDDDEDEVDEDDDNDSKCELRCNMVMWEWMYHCCLRCVVAILIPSQHRYTHTNTHIHSWDQFHSQWCRQEAQGHWLSYQIIGVHSNQSTQSWQQGWGHKSNHQGSCCCQTSKWWLEVVIDDEKKNFTCYKVFLSGNVYFIFSHFSPFCELGDYEK